MSQSTYAERGNTLLMEGEVDEAIAAYDAGLKADGKDVGCMLGRARIHLASSEPDEAAAMLERLVAVDPNHAEARSHLALIRAEEGNDEAVETLAQLAEREDAGFPEVFNYGIAIFERGDWDAAEPAFRRAQKLQPDNPAVWLHLGMLAGEREDLDTARDCFDRANQCAPDEFLPLLMKA